MVCQRPHPPTPPKLKLLTLKGPTEHVPALKNPPISHLPNKYLKVFSVQNPAICCPAFKINPSTNKEEGPTTSSLPAILHEKGEKRLHDISASEKTKQEDGMNGALQGQRTCGLGMSAGCSCLGSKPLLVVTHFYPCNGLWWPDRQPKRHEIILILHTAPLGHCSPHVQHPRINDSSATFERITDPSHSFFGSRLTECFPHPLSHFFFHLKSSARNRRNRSILSPICLPLSRTLKRRSLLQGRRANFAFLYLCWSL